ncbi:MAG TPA: ATP-dependent 6-phosphofructokinase [Bacteroidales bacterium]|jgi:6-phosphofructokinase 1|nr:ATP-dependent 6-phosphofructokinase [Bacteroidales bacterium]MDI9532877.1 ATP-dependent 6-phosphofructokinase [Bacteroidota bacterium]OPZ52997.1 MAG: 6-phosphofructokinase [Bacteroidetes bacterium ADurb.BinA012]HHV13934.1 ATP-dependent 6-phosphofructokinase [Clostridiales bacterium]MBP7037141.1 ATP-dependent 6-phosphofructokinase [Bacteroidales bacterium]
MKYEDFIVSTLGNRNVISPLKKSQGEENQVYKFIDDDERVIYDVSSENYEHCRATGETPVSFEKAGPKEMIYFEPAKTKVGIVTCGGLCPGLNNVIRSLVNQLYYRYGIKRILGFRYGYEGLISEYNHEVIEMTAPMVREIHLSGGTFLGTSRGHQDVSKMVDTIEILNINVLFCIGGDGTLRGAHAIHEEIKSRNLKIAVAGIPKTIDNDINLIQKSFGFETAFSIAHDIIRNAHNEARDAYNGIALIKLMGRDSGFIAANAALAVQEVNFVLIPELSFDLYGEKGFLKVLKERLDERHHAVIVVAEGAGQDLFPAQGSQIDASGNIIHQDIGIFLRDKIKTEFKALGFPHALKYIDPSYIIRSSPANANDSKFCNLLAQNAVHGALAGRTDFVIGYWNNQFTLMPIPPVVAKRKKIDVESGLWWNVLEATGQPVSMKND